MGNGFLAGKSINQIVAWMVAVGLHMAELYHTRSDSLRHLRNLSQFLLV